MLNGNLHCLITVKACRKKGFPVGKDKAKKRLIFMEIPRPEKILVAMYQLAKGSTTPIEYEDIVVRAWELFPEEFGLRKYVRQYPDASDIHKPLYGPLKNRGFVLSGNKKFKLTERGIAYASELEKVRQGLIPIGKVTENSVVPDRLSRDKENEVKRITETDAFRLFALGQQEKILDTDFYSYLGATVRTERHEFLGRLTAVEHAVRDAAKISQNQKYKIAETLHQFLISRFSQIIARKKALS